MMLKKLRLSFRRGFLVGLCLSVLSACTMSTLPSAGSIDSFDSANNVLQEILLPRIQVEEALISDAVASQYATEGISDPVPRLEDFPLYGAQPTQDAQIVYLEIFSTTEKANAQKRNERWLVDVVEQFNAQRQKLSSGQVIQVGVRNLPGGIGQQLLAAGAKPAGYSPANNLWLALLEENGIQPITVAPSLLADYVGFVVDEAMYQELAAGGLVTFQRLLDAILAGQVKIGYPTPYASSTALNLLYTVLWAATGHQQNEPMTVADLRSPQVQSVFDAFQKQVVVTGLTSRDLRDIFLRDRQKLQAFPTGYQTYRHMDVQQTQFIPFGMPHTSPLVGFDWNTPLQQDALKQFAAFAMTDAMQQLAVQNGFEGASYQRQQNYPPMPSGEVLEAVQSFWKQRKDGGRTVHMMMVIDTSGSMEGDRLDALKTGLQAALNYINSGNQVGLITFGDTAQRLVKLAPFDTLQYQRLLAAIDALTVNGGTAMYDGTLVGLADLMDQMQADPDGRYYLLLLTDGEVNRGHTFDQIKDILTYSNVRIYPIAYGEVNAAELEAIANLRESSVKTGTPKDVEQLLQDLFQTNL